MKDKVIIKDSVFYWNKQDYALFYCADNFTRLLVDKNKSSEFVRAFCDNLAKKENLQTTIISHKERDKALISLIKELECAGFVRRVENDSIDCSLPRYLYLNNDLDNINNDELRLIAARENTSIADLNTINFFMGGKTVKTEYHSQCLYPVCSEVTLSYSSVIELIHKVIKSNTGVSYNIIISEVDNSGEFKSFVSDLEQTGQRISFYALNNYPFPFFEPIVNNTNIEIHLIIDNQNSYMHRSDILWSSKYFYHYVIRNEKDFFTMEQLRVNQPKIQPLLIAEDNLDFIIKTCFLDINDRMSLNCPANVIFCHQKININNWGKLYVYPDGNVFSSGRKSNTKCLGSYKDSVSELIAREVANKVSWRKIRTGKKCSNCVFQWLCPSPSSIEDALGIECVCK